MTGTLQVENIIGPTTGANTNKVIIPTGQLLSAPGHPVQTIQTTHYHNTTGNLGRVTLTTTTYTDIMSTSITTKFANSKILIESNCIGYSGSDLRGRGKMFRGTTQIIFDPYAWHMSATDMHAWDVNFIDTVNVAAGTLITYKIQAANFNSPNPFYVKYADGGGTTYNHLTLTEIAV